MTREQAIKELTELLPEEFLSEYAEAIRIGIEALEQDLISRKSVLKIIGDIWLSCSDYGLDIDHFYEEVVSAIENELPSVPKMGQWKRINKEKYVQHAMSYYRCSECGKEMIGTHNYCPNCGAKMEVEE